VARTKIQNGTVPADSVESAPVAPPIAPAAKPAEGAKFTLPYDSANEAAIIAATYHEATVRTSFLRRLVVDHFQERIHREIWGVYVQAEQRKLIVDLSLVEQLGSREARDYLAELAELRPEQPANLGFHLANVLWDHARVTAARGPIQSFLEGLRDPKSDPARVVGLARSIVQCFDGHEDRKYLHDSDQIVRDQMREIEARVNGLAVYPYGVRGLDYYDKLADDGTRARRMLPGAAPGQITVVTGVSGGGKTTFTAHIVLGLAFPQGFDVEDSIAPGRTVLYGAWEMKGGMTLELLACVSLGWSRTELTDPSILTSPIRTPEGRAILQERMRRIAARVRFLANPFRRRTGEKASNERNLDILQGYIADAGCEVFVGDLWKRCLRHTDPEEEEEALIRQQMMTEELQIHAILLQQQRLKDIEQRPDKRPTREGIKGSGAWIEIADTIIAPHRPALFKRCTDNKLEVFVLKQRYGKWPLGIEFDWESDSGSIGGGRSIEYDRPGEQNEADAFLASGKSKLAGQMRR
jgi:replicative DNA helicase